MSDILKFNSWESVQRLVFPFRFGDWPLCVNASVIDNIRCRLFFSFFLGTVPIPFKPVHKLSPVKINPLAFRVCNKEHGLETLSGKDKTLKNQGTLPLLSMSVV